MCNQRFDPWSSDDPTVRARERGRSITKALSRALTADGLTDEMRDRISQGDPAAWAFHILPSGGYTEPLKRLSPLEERAMDGDR